MKSRKSTSLARIKKLAQKPDDLHIWERKFVVALNNFFIEMDRYRELLGDLTIFASLIDYMDQIENGLDEGMGWVLDTYDGKLEFKQLLERLEINVAPELESLLDTQISLDIAIEVAIFDESMIAQIELLIERYWEDIRQKGYVIHSFIIGSE